MKAPERIWLTREELPEFEDTHKCEHATLYHHEDTVTDLQAEVDRLREALVGIDKKKADDGNHIDVESIGNGRLLYRVYWKGEPRSVWGSRYEANMALLDYTYEQH